MKQSLLAVNNSIFEISINAPEKLLKVLLNPAQEFTSLAPAERCAQDEDNNESVPMLGNWRVISQENCTICLELLSTMGSIKLPCKVSE